MTGRDAGLSIEEILARNHEWSARVRRQDPEFFARVAIDQAPDLLWIGCSDSRVGPDTLIRLPMGSIFVHRNIANVFAGRDLNCLSVLEYAVDELRVPNVIVCGHYRCGGIRAALRREGDSATDRWLDPVRRIRRRHGDELAGLDDETRWRRLAELNVEAQVENICRSRIVQAAWRRGQAIQVQGVIYDLHDGLLHPQGRRYASLDDWRGRRS